MYIDNSIGSLCFDNKLVLSPFITKNEIMKNVNLTWEEWPTKVNDANTYRTIFNIEKNSQGPIYLIITFTRHNVGKDIIDSWRLAPKGLLLGEQKKRVGKVTKNLRKWFKEKSNGVLPVYGKWGSIDAAYDPHNKVGAIFCYYRSGLKNDNE